MKMVEQFYDSYVELEWNRMERHPLEFALTKRALASYLQPGSKILDVGGGPGRYAFYLASVGHEVTLLDISSKNVEFAEAKAQELALPLAGYIHGNALDLEQFETDSFDAVLLMGPMYHLIEEQDRMQALDEALRVLKPGGVLFVAFINRFATIFDTLIKEPQNIGTVREKLEGVLNTGINMPAGGAGFTAAYFADPSEVVPLMEAQGLKTIRYISAEGFGIQSERRMKELSAEQFALWVDLSWELAAVPTLLGSGMHMLYIGRAQG